MNLLVLAGWLQQQFQPGRDRGISLGEVGEEGRSDDQGCCCSGREGVWCGMREGTGERMGIRICTIADDMGRNWCASPQAGRHWLSARTAVRGEGEA